MTNDKHPADIEPSSDDAAQLTDENDTEGHSLLSAQLGGVIANERAREAAKWAIGEKARKQQQRERGKDGHR
jgi:hypothetical protein